MTDDYSPFYMIPLDTIKLILLNLSLPQIFKMCRIDKYLDRICRDDNFWKTVMEIYFPGAVLKLGYNYKQTVVYLSTPKIILILFRHKLIKLAITGDVTIEDFQKALFGLVSHQKHLINNQIFTVSGVLNNPVLAKISNISILHYKGSISLSVTGADRFINITELDDLPHSDILAATFLDYNNLFDNLNLINVAPSSIPWGMSEYINN